MKKILILTQNLSTGGVQKSAAMLLNALCDIYDCTVLLFEERKPIQYKISNAIKIKYISMLKVNISDKNIGMEIFNYRLKELSSIVQTIKPDLIFSYEDYHNILSLCITSDAKRVVSSRISLANVYTKTSAIHLLEADFYLKNIKQLYKNADAVVCVSKFIKDELLAISAHINAINIYNGIDQTEVSKVANQELTLNFDYILHVGRLHPQKGQKDLILAYNKVHFHIDEKLLIIGDGPIKKELEELVKSLNLSEKVLLLGSISEPYNYMKKAKFCVIPSHQEGFCNTVLEMMFTSCIIASKYDGYDEILNDYGNLIKIGDIRKLEELLLKYSTDKQSLQSLRQKQKSDVQSFTIQKSMKEYIKLIKEVIHG